MFIKALKSECGLTLEKLILVVSFFIEILPIIVTNLDILYLFF